MSVSTKKRYAKTFYKQRDLPTPRQEIWPENSNELVDALSDPGLDIPLLLLGDGQHVRPSVIGERLFDVVRTESCRRVLSVDRESKLVRVECGIRWGDLQDELRERGLTMERSGLNPSTATIGGLLGRHHGVGRELWDGDLRSSCIALSGFTPTDGQYGYLPAPRKASGPDMRYLFIGGEGFLGAILDATFVVWRPSEARLFSWEISALEAVAVNQKMLDMGIHIAWACHVDGTFHAAVFASDGVLRSIEREISLLNPTDIGGRDDVTSLRKSLELAHPDRRESKAAGQTHRAIFSTEHIGQALTALGDAEVDIWDFTRHRATLFVTYPKAHVPTELPGKIASLTHSVSLVASDEAVHWSQWSQSLKNELDRDRRLAVGP